MKTNKRGISLIVLVITIIVMIILAAAIILSLNGAGIIGKANEAKSKNDAQTALEHALVLKAEYMLKTNSGKIDPDEVSLRDYIKENMGDKAKNIAVSADGEVLAGLTEVAVEFVENDVKVGTVVTGYELPTASTVSVAPGQEYTISLLTSTASTAGYNVDGIVRTGTVSGTWTEGASQTVTALVNPTWRYMGIGSDGNALIIADMPAWENLEDTNKVQMGYEGGYLYGADYLNSAADALYTTAKGKGRAMNIEDVVRLLDCPYKGGYFGADGKFVGTKTLMTFEQILNTLNKTTIHYKTPNKNDSDSWNDIKGYKSNYIAAEITENYDKDGEAIVYQEGAYYWIATPYIYVGGQLSNPDLAYGMAVHGGAGTSIGGIQFMNSSAGTNNTKLWSRPFRPVVALTGTLDVEFGTTVELKNVK